MLTKNDLTQIREVVRGEVQNEVQKEVTPIKKDLKIVHTKLNKLQKTLDVAINTFDRRDEKLQKRVKRIENHIGLSN